MGKAKFNTGMELQGQRGQGLGWGLGTWVYDCPSPDLDPDQCVPHWSLSLQGHVARPSSGLLVSLGEALLSSAPLYPTSLLSVWKPSHLHPPSSVSWVSFIPSCPSSASGNKSGRAEMQPSMCAGYKRRRAQLQGFSGCCRET